jgi:hypothetical protein
LNLVLQKTKGEASTFYRRKSATDFGGLVAIFKQFACGFYHPLTMPPAFVKAHNELDKAVDLT